MDKFENSEPQNSEDEINQEIPEPSPDYQTQAVSQEPEERDSGDSREIMPETKLIGEPAPKEPSIPKPDAEKMTASEERTWAMLAHLSVL